MLKTTKTKLFYFANSVMLDPFVKQWNATMPLRFYTQNAAACYSLATVHLWLQTMKWMSVIHQGCDKSEVSHLNHCCQRGMWRARRLRMRVRTEPGPGLWSGCGPRATLAAPSQRPTCLFLDLAEHTVERRLHPMAIQSMLSEREATEAHVRRWRVILGARVKALHPESASSVEISYERTEP